MKAKQSVSVSRVALFSVLLLMLAIVTQQGASVAEAADACFSTHNFGTGTNLMNICISNHGNLVKFESPAGAEHLRVGAFGEGYALCSRETEFGEVHGWDAGFAEDGFGAAVVTQPNGPNTFPLTITRDTVDGVFRLKQTFSRDTIEKDVTITMVVTRLRASAFPGVVLARYFDGDVGGDPDDDVYDLTAHSVWGRDRRPVPFTFEGEGLMLSVLPVGAGLPEVQTYVETFPDWNPNGAGLQTAKHCEIGSILPAPFTGPTSPGDFVGRVSVVLGEINVGRSKTFKVQYRKF